MIVVSVTLHVPVQEQDDFLPVIEALVAASRQEDGVLMYSFAVDVFEPNLLRIFEVYRDEEAFRAHLASPHFLNWRGPSAKFVRSDRFVLTASHLAVS